MRTYHIAYRKDSGIEETRTVVDAHRVEGWRNDYAFFGDPHDLQHVTFLLPRDVVACIWAANVGQTEPHVREAITQLSPNHASFPLSSEVETGAGTR